MVVSGLVLLCAVVRAQDSLALSGIECDSDSDCFYVPETVSTPVPGLLILHCNGAGPADLDSFRLVGDSLGWVLATCHRSRNHRDMLLNDADITGTLRKLVSIETVDSSRVFIFGFSGQGVQALVSMFLHPDMVKGVVAVCAHRGALPLAVWETVAGHFVYLVTRTEDWNRAENEAMHQLFNSQGVVTELEMTGGEHGPGGREELLDACHWLARRVGDSGDKRDHR